MKHILFELEGCPFETLNNDVLIEGILILAASSAKATLLHTHVHKFEPQGVTGFALLAESHISIHTWPEDGRAVCDVFTCGDHTEPEKAMALLETSLKSKSANTTIISRH